MKFLDFLLTFSAVIAFIVAAYLFGTDPGLAQTEEQIVDSKIGEVTGNIKNQVKSQLPQKTSRPPTPSPAEAKPAERAVVPTAEKPKWRYIILHHSATTKGNAKIFDTYHREEKGFPEGLAYHFVIGNGSNSKDGQLETGGRWEKQIPGVHCFDSTMNQQSIGICLVGNFYENKPTEKQIAALVKLLNELCRKYNIPDDNIITHKDVDKAKTDCPGKYFPLAEIKTRRAH